MTEKLPFPRLLMAVPMQFRSSTARIGRLLWPIPLLVATSILALGLNGFADWKIRGWGSAIEIFLAFLWLAYLAALARGKFRDGLVVVCSLVLGIAALEALAARFEAVSPAVVGKGFFAYKPEIGWGAAGPGTFPARRIVPRTGAVIFDVTYTIDRSLLRKTVSSPDGPTIAFFGDSLTFGEGVNDAETMPQALADMTDHRLRVLNFGFPGYGPNQVLRALESGTFDTVLGSRVRLIVLTTAPWQAERTACKPTFTLHGPSYRLHGDGVRHSGACSDGPSLMLREWIQNTALYRTAIEPYAQRLDHDDVELYIRIILETVELARNKYGAATLVPYLPGGDIYLRRSGFTDSSIIERLRRGGAFVIDASLVKEVAEGAVIEIPGDGHPTAIAHLARARSIKAYLASEMPDVLNR